MNEKYKNYRTISHVEHDYNEKVCKLILNVEQLRESPLKDFFGFLQDKIPSDVLEKLQKCIVAKTPSIEEQTFTVALEKLDAEAKNFDTLLDLAKAVAAVQPTSRSCEKDDYLLFLLGKKCLALQLPDQAYKAFYCIEAYHFTREAHFAMSKMLLNKMQFCSSETSDAHHKKMGEQLIGYFRSTEDFHIQAWSLFVEKLRLYAGLATGLEKEKELQSRAAAHAKEENLGMFALIEEDLGAFVLMLELAERIYLLKENSKKLKEKDKQPEATPPGSSPVVILSSGGRQAVGSSAGISSSSNAPANNPFLDDDEYVVSHDEKKLGLS